MKRNAKGTARVGSLLTGLVLGVLPMPVAAHAAGAPPARRPSS